MKTIKYNPKQQPFFGFEVKAMALAESYFRREPVVAQPIQIDTVDYGVSSAVDGNLFTVELTVSFQFPTEGAADLEARVRMIGIFERGGSVTSTSDSDFVNINAPAMVFPFIREHIASLTMKAGLLPILLPTVNFAKLYEKQLTAASVESEQKDDAVK